MTAFFYDDWDDVFRWREYTTDLGRESENNGNPSDNGGCGIIFWVVVALVIYFFWLLSII